MILKRLLRRIRSPRGTAMLEFAMLAPLAIMLMCFAFDFTRILRVEQQLEIGSRAMADLESHWAKHSFDGGSKSNGAYPSVKAKQIVKRYLASTMPGLAPGNFYCKAKLDEMPGIPRLLTPILKILSGNPPDNLPAILQIIIKILGKALDIFTMKTQRYFTDIVPRDQILKVSFSAKMPTLLPRGVYNVLGFASPEPVKYGTGLATISQLRQKPIEKAAPGKSGFEENVRERYWCAMPMMDSAVQPPVTYGRQIKGAFQRYLPKWLQDLLF